MTSFYGAVPADQVAVDVPRPSSDAQSLTRDAKQSRGFVTDHFRPLALLSLASVVTASVVATAAARGATFSARPPALRLADVHTNDRCVVYTYFEDRGMGQTGTVEAWKEIWRDAGWKPVVLSEPHAAPHPEHQETRTRFLTYPTVNAAGYELACYLRYLALAVVGGGYMTDYDTLNVNVPPSPNCAYPPNDGRLTTHAFFVPAMVTGTENEFDRLAHLLFRVDVHDAMSSTRQTMVSDVILLEYSRDAKEVDAAHSFYTAPNRLSDPPCDENGDELPMLFHLSSDMTAHTLGTPDKARAMREWFHKLDESKKGCTSVHAETDEEYAKRYFTMPGVNKFKDALKLHWECGHRECEQSREREAAEALLLTAKDRHGKAVFD